MNKIIIPLLALLVLGGNRLTAQINPVAQTLPYTQTFSTFTGTTSTYPAGWTGNTIAGSLGTSLLTTEGTGFLAMITGGANNSTNNATFIGDMNGKIGILATASNDAGIVLAINTTGVTNVQVTFTAATQEQTAGGRIDVIGLQYQVDSAPTGTAFTTVSGSTYENNNLTTSTSTSTTGSNLDTITVTLPAACNNQPYVLLRWSLGTISGSGKMSFSITNVTVQQGAATPIVNYYTGATGNVDNLATYNTSPTGSGGTTPSAGSFTNGNAIFHISNGNTTGISANWTVSGANSKVVVDPGNKLTIPSTASLTGSIDVSAGDTLTVQNSAFPTFDSISATSTLVFSNLGTLTTVPLPAASGAYGNITFDNTTVNSTVATDITFAGNFTLQNGASYTDASGNLFTSGTANQTIAGNGSIISIKNLENNNTGTSPVKSGTLTLAPNTPMVLANSIIMSDTGIANQFSDGGNTIAVANNVTLGGPASGYNLTGTFVLNLASGTANLRADGSSDPVLAHFSNITVNTSGTGKVSFNPTTGNDTLYVNGNLTVTTSGGKISFNANTISLGGNLTYSPATDLFDVVGGTGTSTIWFNGTIAQTYTSAVTGGNTFYNIAVSNPAGVTFSNSLVNNNNFTVFSGSDVTLASGAQLSVADSITNNATITGAGSVLLNGAAAQAIGGIGTISNLTLNNSAGATITTGDTMKISGILTPTSGTLTTNGGLVLLSNASGTASIGQIGGTVSGNVIAQQYIPGGRRAFRFLGHPFSAAIPVNQLQTTIDITGQGGNTNGFTTTETNNPSAFWYNPITGDGSTVNDSTGWIAFTSTTNSTVGNANAWNQYEGIRVLVRGAEGQGLNGITYTPSAVTYSLTGPVNQGNLSIPLTDGDTSGYNLISNPYPSPVDIGTVITNASNIAGSGFYVWDATQQTQGAYTTIPTGSPYYLQPNASFMVGVTANTSLTFAESNKGATGSALFRSMTGDAITLHVYDSAYNSWDRLFVSFNNMASDTAENYDAAKLHNSDLDFYSFSANDKKLSIDARPYVNGQVIQLGLITDVPQTYIIKAENYNLSAGQELYLHDKYLGQYQQLNDGSEYTFTVTSDPLSQGDNRFELSEADATTGITNVNANGVKMNMIPNPATDNVTINYTTPQQEKTTISIINVIGQQVFTTTIPGQQSGTVNIPVQNMAQGIYIVTLKSGSQSVTERLVKE